MHRMFYQRPAGRDSMFKQYAEKFGSLWWQSRWVEKASRAGNTRRRASRGVLEMPQEAAESTGADEQGCDVDQNRGVESARIVASHGRGSTWVRAAAPDSIQRQAEARFWRRSCGSQATDPRQRSNCRRGLGGPPPSRSTEAPRQPRKHRRRPRRTESTLEPPRCRRRTTRSAATRATARRTAIRWKSLSLTRRLMDRNSRRQVGTLPARREARRSPSDLHLGRPEGVRRSRPQRIAPTAIQNRPSTANSTVRAAARRGRPRGPRAGRCAATHLGDRPVTPCSRMPRDGGG